VRVVAVARVREPLEQSIVVVAGAETQRRERDSGGALALGDIDQRLEVDDADVEIAVGREHDAIDPAIDLAFARELVRLLNSRGTVRRAARLQPIDRTEDLALLAASRRLEDDTGRAGVDNERNAIAFGELVRQKSKGVLEQRQ